MLWRGRWGPRSVVLLSPWCWWVGVWCGWHVGCGGSCQSLLGVGVTLPDGVLCVVWLRGFVLFDA